MPKKYLKTAEVKKSVCPVTNLLKIISSRWTNEILWNLGENKELRFGKLKAELHDVSTKVLVERLRMLEKNGIVCRECEPTIPPAVSYSLTSLGQDIRSAISNLQGIAIQWSNLNKERID